MSQETEENFCELCSARGVKSRLVSYQINFNEAIWLCEVKTVSMDVLRLVSVNSVLGWLRLVLILFLLNVFQCQFPVGCKQLFPRFVVQRSSSEVANWKKKNKPKANKPKVVFLWPSVSAWALFSELNPHKTSACLFGARIADVVKNAMFSSAPEFAFQVSTLMLVKLWMDSSTVRSFSSYWRESNGRGGVGVGKRVGDLNSIYPIH